jgi:hypothetical protein
VAIDTAAILALFRILASEFSATADDDVEELASVCGGWVSSAAFGSRTSEAAARLVAHELTLQARIAASGAAAAGAGAVQSVSTGDLSVAYASLPQGATPNGDDVFRQTIHGLAYLQIRDSRSEVGFGVLT